MRTFCSKEIRKSPGGEGLISGGTYNQNIFCLLVDGPITERAYKRGRGLISDSLRYYTQKKYFLHMQAQTKLFARFKSYSRHITVATANLRPYAFSLITPP